MKTDETEVVIGATPGQRPYILYWGPTLSNSSAEELHMMAVRQQAHGGPEIDIPPTLSNELATGVSGPPGFIAHRSGIDWTAIFTVHTVEKLSDHQVRIICEDSNTALRATYDIAIDPANHVLMAKSSITNIGEKAMTIDWCAALCMPIDERLTKLMSFAGRWAMEFQKQETSAFQGSYVRENKSGRTSHDNFPGLIALADSTSENHGRAAGFHLGWSGNNRVRADRHSDGRISVQMGELFYPGEMELSANETYESPILYAAQTDKGLNHLSAQFHRCLTETVMDGRVNKKPRLVHYNTWEAIYFDHSEEKFLQLAEKAAAVGAERFVLDDGWFGARRNDKAGLGDWWVSKEIYPNGLEPLAAKIRSLGMEFGIWFEPEMVNPDSDLYRAHPDWILEAEGVEQVPFRHQYTLDLTKSEVSEYLYGKISKIVQDLGIAYIKWDMNREIHHPGSAGRGAIHRQTKAVYALIERLRKAHSDLEIESCSSGGARTDFGILGRTDRVWLSDSNDALDRQDIQRGASHFFPLKILGSHVGPKVCHITKRTLSMEFRAATAIFGHMGLELNLLEETPDDIATLKKAIALYKEHRDLLHSGNFVRLETPDYLNVIGVIAKDQSEAIINCVKLVGHKSTLPSRIFIEGLDPAKRYRTTILWPMQDFAITHPSIIDIADLCGEGSDFSGEALAVQGLQLPLTYPETSIIFKFQAV
ncbi:MAG: alpha-galactosidase [Parasphingorhabdus sp.]|uniref:alpha-galactosidase n=1 Tax=Parasphingorhabdus sp. TaxID=2709688 RepID=UPI00329A727C